MAEHRPEIGEIADAQVVSVSCTCNGWSFVQGYARPTGRPVAVRLALLRFGQHAGHLLTGEDHTDVERH